MKLGERRHQGNRDQPSGKGNGGARGIGKSVNGVGAPPLYPQASPRSQAASVGAKRLPASPSGLGGGGGVGSRALPISGTVVASNNNHINNNQRSRSSSSPNVRNNGMSAPEAPAAAEPAKGEWKKDGWDDKDEGREAQITHPSCHGPRAYFFILSGLFRRRERHPRRCLKYTFARALMGNAPAKRSYAKETGRGGRRRERERET